jgi:hypothetical protein
MTWRKVAVVTWALAGVSCLGGRPVARISVPARVGLGETFVADASGSLGIVRPITEYHFDFGDRGTTLISPEPRQSYRYTKEGTYRVTVTVRDSGGEESRARAEVEVDPNCDGCNAPPSPAEINVDACRVEGIRDCLVDFGDAYLGSPARARVVIRNPGRGLLLLSGVTVDGENSNFRVMDTSANAIRGGDSSGSVVELEFNPRFPGTLLATLLIRSNASNLPAGEDVVRVVLRAVATERPTPRFVLNPEECSFGDVPPRLTSTCTVTMSNLGTAPLTVLAMDPTPSTPDVYVLDGPTLPLDMAPASSNTLLVTFAPREPGIYLGDVVFTTTDPGASTAVLNLNGSSNMPVPVAVARGQSVNGQPVRESYVVASPLDDVIVTGEDSRPGYVDGRVVSYRWELVSRPETSTVTLTSPLAAATGFSFNSSGLERRGLDVVGTFVVGLSVTDDQGMGSINRARVTIDTSPTDALHVQLTWEDATSDIDLHVVRDPGPIFDAYNDCYYMNCQPGQPDLGWGSVDQNPHLDIDDVDGFGPENTTIRAPASGTYDVGVHFYAPHGAVPDIPCTVKIYVRGSLRAEYRRRLYACNAFWTVARIVWTGEVEVTTVDGLQMVNYGGCPGG